MVVKGWLLRKNNKEAEDRLCENGVPRLAARVLSARKFREAGGVKQFMRRSLDEVPDPFTLRDMDRAVARLRLARDRGEKVAVYGDYDVDGITATCLLKERLELFGLEVETCIPTRGEDGYGVAKKLIDALAADGVKLMITVDLGITAVEEVEYARTLGMDMIITDHHECPERLPDAVAVVDPLRSGGSCPFCAFAGVGVAFMLALALEGRDKLEELADAVGDLFAIGTIADVMPMHGANRVLVARGLERINSDPRPGIKALVQLSLVEQRKVDENAIGYSLAPRINAAGRMGSAADAANLLLTRDPAEASVLAERLGEMNRERQRIENEMFDEIAARAESELEDDTLPIGCTRALVMSGHGWYQGVVGIVASRMSEAFSRPVFLICVENGVGRGSGRSFYGVNILEIMRRAQHIFESWGGHEYAVGFTIREENIPIFAEIVGEYSPALSPAHIEVDAELCACELEPELVAGLTVLEPYGAGNPPPLFLLKGVELSEVVPLGTGRGVRMRINVGGRSFPAIYFGRDALQNDFGEGDRGDVIVALEATLAEERGEVRMILESMRMPPDEFGRFVREIEVFQRFRAGERISPSEASRLMPSAREAVAVLRYLRLNADENGEVHARISSFCLRICRAEKLEVCYGKILTVLRALAEKERLEYNFEGETISVRLGPKAPVDLNTAPSIVRLRELICQTKGGFEDGDDN